MTNPITDYLKKRKLKKETEDKAYKEADKIADIKNKNKGWTSTQNPNAEEYFSISKPSTWLPTNFPFDPDEMTKEQRQQKLSRRKIRKQVLKTRLAQLKENK
jgi:hypothetical protein